MKANSNFSSVEVVGHSLGGGLAIITGAQTGTQAIALSGPNAGISGRSFDPPVDHEALNRYTFNIIPNHDIVPRFDDRADNFQIIRCDTTLNNFLACHDFTRSFCEIIYTCGTGNRPAVCECHTLYGYPKPLTDGNETFDEVCARKNSQPQG